MQHLPLRHLSRWLLVSVVLLAVMWSALAAAQDSVAPIANEMSRYAPKDISFVAKGKGVFGGDVKLVGTLYSPVKNAGAVPLVILSHGSDADAAARRKMTPRGYANVSRYFLNRGFAVLYFLRPSYGESEGPYLEVNRTCVNADYGPGFEAMADTVMSAYDFAQTLPGIDLQRIIFAGHSAGGTASIAAAARNVKGVVAYINFAGGKGGSETTPYAPCSPQEVSRLFAGYAARTALPALWVYAPNDLYFGGEVAPSWHKATVAAGGKARLFVTAAAKTDRDGHHVVQREMTLWIPTVDGFLKELGFAW